MKKFMIFLVMFVLVIPVIGQVVEPPSDIFDAVANFKTYMASLGGIAVLSLFITGLINGSLQVLKKWMRLAVSWGVPILLAFIGGYLLKIGFLYDAEWWLVILYGFGAGLMANRGYDVDVIQNIILFIESLLGNKAVRDER
jgi:hypothetical protein